MDNFLEFVNTALPEGWEKLTKEEKIDVLIGILDGAKVEIVKKAEKAKLFAEYEAGRKAKIEAHEAELKEYQLAWGDKLK
jgi:hypothetical protein